MKKIVGMVALAFLVAACGGGGGGDGDGEVLRVGNIPNQNPEEVEAQYEPLGEYLSEELDMEVEISVPTSYTAVVEAMASDRLDLAHFGGLTYVQAKERVDVEPLITEINTYTGTTNYRSLIIVPADSDIEDVSELEGESFAFGSVSSTSGSLYPSIMLAEAGIDYRTDLSEALYTGGHDAASQAVVNETVAAGGVEDRILYDLQEAGVVDEDAIRILDESEDVEGYPWAVREDMDDGLKEDIAEAFIAIDDPELLDLFRAEGFERVEDSDYDYVDEQARELDLLIPDE